METLIWYHVSLLLCSIPREMDSMVMHGESEGFAMRHDLTQLGSAFVQRVQLLEGLLSILHRRAERAHNLPGAPSQRWQPGVIEG